MPLGWVCPRTTMPMPSLPTVIEDLGRGFSLTGDDGDSDVLVGNAFPFQTLMGLLEKGFHQSPFGGHEPFFELGGDMGDRGGYRLGDGPRRMEEGHFGVGSGQHEGRMVGGTQGGLFIGDAESRMGDVHRSLDQPERACQAVPEQAVGGIILE